jgi:hypothetical protein
MGIKILAWAMVAVAFAITGTVVVASILVVI